SFGKKFWRRDRDHLVPPRRMDAAVCRAEVCYPFGREHGRHRAVNRRAFITLLGGTAATWPLSAVAQGSKRVPRIGVLMELAETDSQARSNVPALQRALRRLGWIDGRNLELKDPRTSYDPGPVLRISQYIVQVGP